MAYNDMLTRGSGPTYSSTPGVHPLIPEDVSKEIIKAVTHKSAALTMFTKRQMSSAQQRMPVLATKPNAYFVSGDTGLKQTTTMSWKNKFLDAEEIAVIVPIPEKVLDDTEYDIWAEVKPEIEEAIALALDGAIFFGIGKPASWPDDIEAAAIAAGNTITAGSQTPNDVAKEISAVMATIEADGFDPTGFFMQQSMRATVRDLRATDAAGTFKGEFIFNPAHPGMENTAFKGVLYGLPAVASMSSIFETADADHANHAKLIAGDFKQAIIGVRQDITYKLLDQSVITDGDGNIIFNLAQQDMVALRVVARFGFQVPNPITRMQPTEGNRYPFGVLLAA